MVRERNTRYLISRYHDYAARIDQAVKKALTFIGKVIASAATVAIPHLSRWCLPNCTLKNGRSDVGISVAVVFRITPLPAPMVLTGRG